MQHLAESGAFQRIQRSMADRLAQAFAPQRQLQEQLAQRLGEQVRQSILHSTGFQALNEAMAVQSRRWAKQMEVAFAPMQRLQTQMAASVAEGFRRARRAQLPPNLRDLEDVEISTIESFVETEGIPLYLVPRAPIARSLLLAPTRQKRRAVLGRNYNLILDDCSEVLSGCGREWTASHVEYALEAICAAQSGYPSAAQALATNVLDSALTTVLPRQLRHRVTSHRETPDADELREFDLRWNLVVVPIWHAHRTFQVHAGDRVPHAFSRHASVHVVGRRQFSKRNTVQVIMLLTGLLGFAEDL
ncbi:MAG: hypothetical protein JWO77_1286 [Ilumatobacteraceae bacterium]|nr:hypothetical protein [Ilumatobacteraceae bacterium]